MQFNFTPFSKILCFVDASTKSDNGLSHLRRAGLGIYIVNLQVQPPNFTYIRTISQQTYNVIYVEAAALALAAVITHRLGLYSVDFLSDSLQMIQDYTRDRNSSVLKIDRQFNCIAYFLGSLAFSSSKLQYPDYVPSCSYEHRDLQCPLLTALSSVPLDFSRVLTPSCC
jgi:hypothetical protein